jgi:hypothetical protein
MISSRSASLKTMGASRVRWRFAAIVHLAVGAFDPPA